jgi:hypothetical protein
MGQQFLRPATCQSVRPHVTLCAAGLFFKDNDNHSLSLLIHQALHPEIFSYFPKMKLKLKSRQFEVIEEIHAKSEDMITMFTQNDFH